MPFPDTADQSQDVAASCIFLATKTEECGRKLRDVARVYQAKVQNADISTIPADSKVGIQLTFSIRLFTRTTGGRSLPVCYTSDGGSFIRGSLLRLRCR